MSSDAELRPSLPSEAHKSQTTAQPVGINEPGRNGKPIAHRGIPLATYNNKRTAERVGFGLPRVLNIWVPHDERDLVADFVRRWSEKAEIGVGRFIPWLGVTASKFYDWPPRYGRQRAKRLARDFWLDRGERSSPRAVDQVL